MKFTKVNEYSTQKLLKRMLFIYVKPYYKNIIISIFFMIISALCSVNIVKLVQPMIDQIFLEHNEHMLYFIALFTLITFAIKGVCEYFQFYIIKFVAQNILLDMQMQMYEHLLISDVKFIKSQSTGRLISNFANDISMMRGAALHLLVGCAKHFLSVSFLIILMLMLNSTLSLIVFIVFPVALYPIQKFGKKIREISEKTQIELSNFTFKLDEVFNSIKIVKSFLGERYEIKKARHVTENILHFYKKNSKFDALVAPTMEILSGFTVAFLILYGGILVIQGKTTPGTLFAFITAFISTYRPFKSLISLNANLQETLSAAKRIFTILDTQPEIKDCYDAQNIKIKGLFIEFKNVVLCFDKKLALNNFTCIIPYGQTIAFLGASGSGKTSIANLLIRFDDVTSGNIMIGSYDIKNIKLTSLREQISIITQDTLLFDLTIFENISYGSFDATIEDVILAAKHANAHDFIMNLPDQYNTMIGGGGFKLSGGQRQRLSIARAILKDADILICDEATSSLDQISEKAILKYIKDFRQSKTNIFITHRLINMKDFDHIIFMKSGKIFEQGTHDQLLNNKSEYYKLYNNEIAGL
jgi:subfamily B ATP-binding cassette protein MsbA